MEDVYKKIAQDTTKFNLGDEETWRELYEPFQGPKPDNVNVTRDHRYGPADRNFLDVYSPAVTPGKNPVILYMHGGGFFSGDKAWSEKYYANIGNFFASKGMVVVVVNHQLIPFDKNETEPPFPEGQCPVKYPAGADDVQMAREWIYENIEREEFGSGSKDQVILFGHSSGGAHIAMNLYAAGDPERASKSTAEVFPPVAGIIYLSVPFWFDRTRPIRQKILQRYYGSDAEDVWGPKSVLGLFRGLPDDAPILDAIKFPTYIGTVRWEVTEAFDAAMAFFVEYRNRSVPAGTNAIFHVLDRHNHLSNVLSIGTKDTAQAEELLKFIQSEKWIPEVDKNKAMSPGVRRHIYNYLTNEMK